MMIAALRGDSLVAATVTTGLVAGLFLNPWLAISLGGDLAAVRERFETEWVRWNIARVVASTAAFGCLVLALLRSGS